MDTLMKSWGKLLLIMFVTSKPSTLRLSRKQSRRLREFVGAHTEGNGYRSPILSTARTSWVAKRYCWRFEMRGS